MIDIIKPLISKFMPFAQKRMGFDKPPRLFLRSDVSNADNPLGKTAYYDPNEQKVVLYVTGRHPKDVMRSLSHELVHHTQNCRGDFDNVHEMGDGYAQNDAHLREMEREAYETGNLCFRDWEDSIKHTIYFEHLQKGVATIMSTKDWKNKEIQGLLSEAWGFSMNLDALTEAKGREPENEEEEEFAALADPKKLITRADTIAGATMEEDEELEEIIDTSPDAEDRGRGRGKSGKKKKHDKEDLDEQKLREAVRKALKVSTNMVSESEDENIEDIMSISRFIEKQPEWGDLTDLMSRGVHPGAPDVVYLARQFFNEYGEDWRQHEQDIIKDLEHMSKRNEDRKLREAVRKALKVSTNMVSERSEREPKKGVKITNAIANFIKKDPDGKKYLDVMSQRGTPGAVDVYHLAGQFYKQYGKKWGQNKQNIINALMDELNEDRKLREAVRKALKASIKKA